MINLKIIPDTQFGVKEKHSSLHQVHHITDTIFESLERKPYCVGVFFDVPQAFYRVWHAGILHKIRFLPAPLYLTIKSFLTNRSFLVRCDEELSNFQSIQAGVPQGSVLALTLYNIFTYDTPHVANTTLATFAGDIGFLTSNNNLTLASETLQNHLNKIQN